MLLVVVRRVVRRVVRATIHALDLKATAILSQTNSLAEGPMNVMSVVFVAEAGAIVAVEVAPAAAGAVDPAVESSVGWSKVYQFVSGMVNQNRPPLSVPALLGNMVGKLIKSLMP